MRKYYSGEILFCGVLRRDVSKNIVAITETLRLNRFICCMYLTDRFSQLLRCDVELHFIMLSSFRCSSRFIIQFSVSKYFTVQVN